MKDGTESLTQHHHRQPTTPSSTTSLPPSHALQASFSLHYRSLSSILQPRPQSCHTLPPSRSITTGDHCRCRHAQVLKGGLGLGGGFGVVHSYRFFLFLFLIFSFFILFQSHEIISPLNLPLFYSPRRELMSSNPLGKVLKYL